MGITAANWAAGTFKLGILAAIAGVSVYFATSQMILSEPLIATAVTIDLVITFPIVYFLVIRKSSIPQITVVPVFLLSVLFASLMLPAENRYTLGMVIAYLVPAAELFVVGYLVYRIYRTRREYKAYSLAGHDMMERLRIAFVNEIKPAFVARAAAFEVGVFLAAFLQWRRPKLSTASDVEFTYHRSNSSVPLLSLFLFLLIAETVVVHILLAMWNTTVAWVFTALSVYFAIQIVAHLKAILFRSISVARGRLFVRCGILGDVAIDLASIDSISVTEQTPEDRVDVQTLTSLGALSRPNVVIELGSTAVINGIYGRERSVKLIALTIDEPQHFVEFLQNGSRPQLPAA